MSRRPSTIFVGVTLAMAAVLAAVLLAGSGRQPKDHAPMQQKRGVVRALDLTDLCLFTEASYTRHPATTDLATPFQDSPGSLEHFPSGALVPPPANR